jgi:hypothetical protein
MRMGGFSWAALNFLWLVPVVIGIAFVAAVLVYAAWRTYSPQRSQVASGWPERAGRRVWGVPVEPGYAGSKPGSANERFDTPGRASPRRIP